MMKSEIDKIEEIKDADFNLKDEQCPLKNRDEIIDHYVTNELTEAAREAFDEHCFNCDVCFQALEAREKFVGLVKKEGKRIFADVITKKSRPAFGFKTLIDKLINPGMIRPAEWAFAAAAMIVILGAALFFRNTQQPDFLASIQYDDQVPYTFAPQFGVSLRSSSSETDKDFSQFYNRFLAAMAEYKNLDYSRAADMLETLKLQAERLQEYAGNDTINTTVRDFYFYSGATYLALAQSKDKQPVETTRQQHLASAANNFERVVTLAAQFDLDFIDRDHYFLGLAYSLTGDRDRATHALEKIQASSRFYEMSKKILKPETGK